LLPEVEKLKSFDSYSCEDYINKELNEELHPHLMSQVLATRFFSRSYFNGCCVKLTSNLNAKVGLFILSNARQHKVFFFIILTSLHL